MVSAGETVSVYALKAHLSEVLARVERTGVGVVVTRHGRPAARLEPIGEPGAPRAVGVWRGKMRVPDGWDEFTEADAEDGYGA
jgi:prevent-host-death family protein